MSIELMVMNPQRSDWSSEEDVIVQHDHSSTISKRNNLNSNNLINDLNENESKKSKVRSICKLLQCCSLMSPLCQGLILGMITAGLLLVIVIVLWVTSMHVTSTTSNINTQVSTGTTTSATSTTATTTTTSTESTTSITSTTQTTTTTTATSTSSTTTTTSPTCSSAGHGTLATFIGTPFSWTQYQYNYTATATAHTIMFGFTEDPGGGANRYWYLDDVSIVDVTAPTIQLLQNPSFDNSTTALTGWTQYCTSTCPSGGTNSGQVATGANCLSTNCYMDHCYGFGPIDFLSQTFSTTVGHVYTISFWIQDYGSGPNAATRTYVDIY